MELCCAETVIQVPVCISNPKHEQGGIVNGLKIRVKPVVSVLDFLTAQTGSQKV